MRNDTLKFLGADGIKSITKRFASDERGTTLIELVMTLILTLIVVSVVPPLLMATNTANTTSQQLSFGTSSASVGIQTIDNYLASSTFVCIPPANTVLPSTNTDQNSYIVGSSGNAVLAESDAFNGPANPEWVEFVIPQPAAATTAPNSTPVSDNILYWRVWSASAGTGTNGITPPNNTAFAPIVQPVYNSQKNAPTFSLATSGNGPDVLTTNLYVGSIFKARLASNGLPTNIVNMTNNVAALNTNPQSTSSSGTSTTPPSTATCP